MAVEEQLQWTLKTIYPDGRPKFLGWEDAPLLSMVKKRPDFGGKEWKWAAYHGQPQNRSADPLTAFTGDHQQTGKEFVINRVQNYSSFRIQRETIMASMKVGSDSYIDDLKSGIDGTMNQFMLDTYYDLFLDGSGVRGSIGGIGNASGAYVAGDDIANTVITLSDVSRAIYFEEGQVLCFATAQTTGNVKDGAAGKETFVTNSPVVIRAVNYIEGTIQVNKDLSLLNTAVTVGDFIFHQGDRNKKPKGLDAWCPAVDPTQGENFFGVDRSSNPVRLAGIRVNDAGLSISEKVLRGIKVAQIHGVSFPVVIMHPDNVETLTLELGAKQNLPVVDVASYEMANVFFKGIQIHGHGRTVAVVSDRACQIDTAWGMNPAECFEIDSLGGYPEIIQLNNGQFFQETDDSFRVRIGGYAQYRASTPKKIVRISLNN